MGKDLKGKELGKGIVQCKDGRYQARYVDRFGERKSIYSTNKSDIKNKLKLAIAEDAEKKSVKRKMTVNEWCSEWFEKYKTPVIRPNTKRHYEHILKTHILPEIGGYYVDELKQIHVKTLLNDLDKNGYQWETQNKVRLLIMDMFNVAIENDYALKNPTKGIKLAKNKPNERTVLTVEQQEQFFECSAGTFYDNLFVVAVNTGLRPGEICALDESRVNFNEKTIRVDRTLIYQKFDGDDSKTFHLGEPKTDSSYRNVPMNAACENALRKQITLKKLLSAKYPKEGEFKDLLFVSKFNNPICAEIYCDAIERIVAEINLQRDEIDKFPAFSPHSLRHTFATRCIEAGIQPKVLQRYLGHATIQMTMNLYVHVTDEFMEEEMLKLDEAFPEKRTGAKIIPMSSIKVV